MIAMLLRACALIHDLEAKIVGLFIENPSFIQVNEQGLICVKLIGSMFTQVNLPA
ncbi:hypothetical protein BN2497_12563 [Janthinobacterium sp. CG23_2]|nr:hypothetical protein BN2497_12563 [Janthinobacterium sp. CG23_2]CUU32679.1 hypothetical protein BN3177_12563 [Janthinobacterium sp. CG23_2]